MTFPSPPLPTLLVGLRVAVCAAPLLRSPLLPATACAALVLPKLLPKLLSVMLRARPGRLLPRLNGPRSLLRHGAPAEGATAAGAGASAPGRVSGGDTIYIGDLERRVLELEAERDSHEEKIEVSAGKGCGLGEGGSYMA